MTKLGVLASGRGSNFQSIIDAIGSGGLDAEIACLITDNDEAYAIERAKQHGIPHVYINPSGFETKDVFYRSIADELKFCDVELVVLAGFMRVVKKPLIDAFPMRIMNIHPALLPSFKGLHAQRQALEYGVKIAGCTVHFVDEGVDTGPIILQEAVPVFSDDTEESLSERILEYEHQIYPRAIKLYTEGRLMVTGNRVIVAD
ncbi:MAG: phosphoribosylglycinamide formyltransferase [Nitrospirae bacterium]|nr:phosphoribosylglycinamide formyltransferase [Nitrospirota bacterium]